LTSKRLMSPRTKIILSFAFFAPTSLWLLTGPSPSASWAQMGHSGFTFSLIADGLAWLICLVACLMVIRLAHHLRDRVPFALTAYILGLFVVCFGLQRVVGYALWGRLGGLEPQMQMVRAAASVVVAMGVAVLFPYVR